MSFFDEIFGSNFSTAVMSPLQGSFSMSYSIPRAYALGYVYFAPSGLEAKQFQSPRSYVPDFPVIFVFKA